MELKIQFWDPVIAKQLVGMVADEVQMLYTFQTAHMAFLQLHSLQFCPISCVVSEGDPFLTFFLRVVGGLISAGDFFWEPSSWQLLTSSD